MAFDIDKDNPGNTSQISQFPSNERASREAIEECFAVEHDYTVGTGGEVRHKFGRGDIATRDGITDWVDGSLWILEDATVAEGSTLLQVYNGSAWVTTDIELLDVTNQWTAGQSGEYVELTDDTSVTSDWDDGNFFKLTTTQSFTLENPDLPDHGNDEAQSAVYVITQDSGGGNAITYGTMFRGAYGASQAAGGMPVLSTDGDAVDILYCTLLPGGTHIAVSALIGIVI